MLYDSSISYFCKSENVVKVNNCEKVIGELLKLVSKGATRGRAKGAEAPPY